MTNIELLQFIDEIEQDIRDVQGNEESMREQLIVIADSIMKRLEEV